MKSEKPTSRYARRRRQTVYGALGVLALILFGFVQGVWGHGGGILRVNSASVGAYAVSVWVNPPVPRSNETLHMTVGIAGREQEPVLDAAVSIEIRSAVTGELVTAQPATTAQSVNRLFYETDFPTLEPGQYDVLVIVEGSLGSGEVTFQMEMLPASAARWVTAVLAIIGLSALGGTILLWRRQGGHDRKRPLPPKRLSHNKL